VKRVDQYRESVWHSPELTTNEKVVALALSKYMDFDNLGSAHPGHAALQRLTSLSKKTVERTIAGLVDKQWLTETHHGGSAKGGRRRASVYRGRLPTGVTESPVRGSRLASQSPVTGVRESPHPSKDPRRPSRADRKLLHIACATDRYEQRHGDEIVTYDRRTHQEIARRAVE
jgi:hypothetical protein